MRTRVGNKERAILEAAIAVFADHGYHGARVSAIARRAGVATGSVYLYFPNKEAILLRIFDDLWSWLSHQLTQALRRPGRTPQEKLDFIIDLVFDAFTANPPLAIVFVNEQNRLVQAGKGNVGRDYTAFLDLSEQVVREGIRAGVFHAGLDVTLARHFLTGGLRTLLHLWASAPGDTSLEHIRRNVKSLMKSGLQEPRGAPRVDPREARELEASSPGPGRQL